MLVNLGLISLCAGIATPAYFSVRMLGTATWVFNGILLMIIVTSLTRQLLVSVKGQALSMSRAPPRFIAIDHKTSCLLSRAGLLIVCFLVGACYACWRAELVLTPALEDDWQPQWLILDGQVNSLVEVNTSNGLSIQRFNFKVNQAYDKAGQPRSFKPREVRLSQYAKKHKPARFKVGERWLIQARIKNIRSYASTGTFDYRLWLFKQGITAQGSIKTAQPLPRLPVSNAWHALTSEPWIDRLRASVGERLRSFAGRLYPSSPDRQTRQPEMTNQQVLTGSQSQLDVLLALVNGDRSLITQQRWHTFKATGSAHLMAISGLHIGLLAGVFYWLVNGLLKYCSALLRGIPSFVYASYAAILAALLYAGLAGFSLPTQRALIMLIVMLSARSSLSLIGWGTRFVIALAIVLLIDPWALLSSGAFLSFLAVGVLCLALTGYLKPQNKLVIALKSQYYLLWMMLPLSLYFFDQLAVVAVPVNLIALTLFGLVITPLLIALLAMLVINSTAAFACYRALDGVMALLMQFLQWFEQWQVPVFMLPTIDGYQLAVLCILAVAIAMLKLRLLMLLYLCVAALCWAPRAPNAKLNLDVIDVGQGLAVLIRTPQHSLLYDVGAAYTSGFNLADAVVTPYLTHLGLRNLDRLILSHNDNDHAGATQYLTERIQVDSMIYGDPKSIDVQAISQNIANHQLCSSQHWRWDGVEFSVVYAQPRHPVSNDRSCALLIRWRDISILLPGDLSQSAEQQLLDHPAMQSDTRAQKPAPRKHLDGAESSVNDGLSQTVIVAPHHGSKSSSSAALIQRFKPQHVIFSVGYQHHYNHPHPSVVKRYQAMGAHVWRTDVQGTISFSWDTTQKLSLSCSHQNKRWWQLSTQYLTSLPRAQSRFEQAFDCKAKP